MDKIPQRNKLAKIYRNILDKYEGGLFFPIKDPNSYQILSILLSFVFLFKPQPVIAVCLILVILLLDWMDGAVARKYNLTSKKGWLLDVAVDRISEGLMFVAYLDTYIGKFLFFLYLLNILGSYYSIKSGKHTLLPLRFLYFIYLIFLIVK